MGRPCFLKMAAARRRKSDRRALSVSRFIDQCGVCRVVAPVDFFGGFFLVGTYAYFFSFGFAESTPWSVRGLLNGPSGNYKGQDATEDILDSDQYGRHSRGMQRRYRGEGTYSRSLLSPFCHSFDDRSIAYPLVSRRRPTTFVSRRHFVCEICRTRVPTSFEKEHAAPPWITFASVVSVSPKWLHL